MEEASKNAPEHVSLIHICDREGDIYELYALAERTGEKFIIRATHNRLNSDNERIVDELRKTEAVGTDIVTIPSNHASKTKEREVELTIWHKEFEIKKPVLLNSNKELEKSLKLTLISLTDENPPAGQEPIEWLLKPAPYLIRRLICRYIALKMRYKSPDIISSDGTPDELRGKDFILFLKAVAK